MSTSQILVLIEQRDGELLKPSIETLGEALDLAEAANQPKPEVGAVLLLDATAPPNLIVELAEYGPAKIFIVRHPALAHFNAQTWTETLLQLSPPSAFLLAATPNGRELAPRLAVKWGAGLVVDSVRVRWETSGGQDQPEIVATVPLYGDRVYSQQQISGAGAVISFRPGARGFDKPGERGHASPEIIELQPKLELERATIQHLKFVPADPRTVTLSEAEKIVCGGAGVGQERFGLMWELAEQLGAAVGGTRVAVDKGWLDWDRQIGQTGQVVAPRLFVSCGTSGAGQHVTGMKDARTVIVINKDRNAPMFSLADIGIVGDVHAIIPSLITKLRELTQTGITN